MKHPVRSDFHTVVIEAGVTVTFKPTNSIYSFYRLADWPAPGSEDTELGVFMELEVSHGKTTVYTRVQA